MISPATFRRSSSACCIPICALLAVIYPASNSQPQNLAETIVALDSPHSPLELCRNCHSEAKPRNLVFVSSRQDEIPRGVYPELCRRARDDSNGRLPHCDTVSFHSGMQTQPQFSDSLRSLDIGKTQSICVELLSDTGAQPSVPIDLGNTLRLSFRHSIYGSHVEELFALRREGFQLTQLRYSEARLVDFYGYEYAKQENGAWVVNPPPVLLPSLSLNTSADAAMTLHLDRHGDAQPLAIQPTGALRLTVASCRNSADG